MLSMLLLFSQTRSKKRHLSIPYDNALSPTYLYFYDALIGAGKFP